MPGKLHHVRYTRYTMYTMYINVLNVHMTMPWQCHDSSNRRPRLQAELRSSKETAETLEQSGEAAAVCCSMQWHSHFAQWRARVVEVMPFSFKLFKFHGLQLAPLSFNSSMLGSVKHCMSLFVAFLHLFSLVHLNCDLRLFCSQNHTFLTLVSMVWKSGHTSTQFFSIPQSMLKHV